MNESERRDPRMPKGYEANPEAWACPDGPYCRDPDCVRIHRERMLCLVALAARGPS